MHSHRQVRMRVSKSSIIDLITDESRSGELLLSLGCNKMEANFSCVNVFVKKLHIREKCRCYEQVSFLFTRFLNEFLMFVDVISSSDYFIAFSSRCDCRDPCKKEKKRVRDRYQSITKKYVLLHQK